MSAPLAPEAATHGPSGMAQGAPEAFEAQWHAQAFALVVRLMEQGVFDAATWAETLGAELAARPGCDGGDGYFTAWLAALERLLAARGLAPADKLDAVQAAWAQAYLETPHGAPVHLPDRGTG